MDWIKYFVLKNASADLTTMTHEQFDRIFQIANEEFPIIDSNDPDLRAFRDRGGKLLSYHGLVSPQDHVPTQDGRNSSADASDSKADVVVPTNGSIDYFESAMAVDENVQDYYRLFLAPGLSHCIGGYGAYPDGTFDAMRKWVEEGVAPDTLNATTISEPLFSRVLCPYPQKQYYDGTGNSTLGEGFYCA